ncbi:energy transducer TonB family protein [Fontivita pretiosa]|uniref:energy transducer TonB family protein n=1 Tax=Fontivita pretiosa TaxID=2989684 RepID=UPI003D168021
MSHRDPSLSIALCASLSLHVLIVCTTAEIYAHRNAAHIRLPGFAQTTTLTAALVETPDDPWNRLGDSDGRGRAIDDASGQLPLLAPQGTQEQAFLSRDPQGLAEVGVEPGLSVLTSGSTGSIKAPPLLEAPTPQQAAPLGISPTAGDFVLPAREKLEMVPAATSQPAPPGNAAAGVAQAGEPGGDAPAADPAPMAQSESDPLTIQGSAEFRPGRTEVRIGRKHKLTRPRLSLAARADLMALASPTVVLKLTIDPSGKVVSASVYRSSGSNEVDQPCKLAAYDWWFEPARDRSGRPTWDVILFSIRFF